MCNRVVVFPSRKRKDICHLERQLSTWLCHLKIDFYPGVENRLLSWVDLLLSEFSCQFGRLRANPQEGFWTPETKSSGTEASECYTMNSSTSCPLAWRATFLHLWGFCSTRRHCSPVGSEPQAGPYMPRRSSGEHRVGHLWDQWACLGQRECCELISRCRLLLL